MLDTLLVLLTLELWEQQLPLPIPDNETCCKQWELAQRDFADMQQLADFTGAFSISRQQPIFERRVAIWHAASWVEWPAANHETNQKWRRRWLALMRGD